MNTTLSPKKFGIDGFQLKIIAMILMVFDHIHYFLTGVYDIPMWFTYIGRVVAPIFIFMSVEGFYYTRNKKKYILRLYIASVIMSLGNSLLSTYFPRPDNVMLMNGMFATIFLIAVHLYIIDYIKENIAYKNTGKIILGFTLLLIPTILSIVFFSMMGVITPTVARIVMTLIPLPLLVEGGLPWIILGIVLYLFRDNKIKELLAYAIYVGILFIVSKFSLGSQTFMIFALPIMALYNGEKGKSMKYLFYIFYPAHVWILYLLSYFLLIK